MNNYCSTRRTGISFDNSEPKFFGEKGEAKGIGRGSLVREIMKELSRNPQLKAFSPEHDNYIQDLLADVDCEDKNVVLEIMNEVRLANAMFAYRYWEIGHSNGNQNVCSKVYSSNARSKQAGGEYCFTPRDWNKTLDFFGNRCAYCNKTAPVIELDHFVPVHEGGGSILGNIIPACHTCNQIKGKLMPDKFLQKEKYDELLGKLKELSQS